MTTVVEIDTELATLTHLRDIAIQRFDTDAAMALSERIERLLEARFAVAPVDR